MKKTFLLFLFFFVFCSLPALEASSPMLEKHIFSPEPEGKGAYKSPMALKLEKEILFTGIIISSQGKWAIIREKKRNKDSESGAFHKEGDEIKGMVIKKIGRNFLILSGEGKDVRLNLYHGGKSRPATPVDTGTTSISSEKVPTGSPDLLPSAGSVPPRALKPPTHGPGGGKSIVPTPTSNPFQQELPPNPFLQQTPPNPFLKESPNPFLEQNPNPSPHKDLPDAFSKNPPPNAP